MFGFFRKISKQTLNIDQKKAFYSLVKGIFGKNAQVKSANTDPESGQYKWSRDNNVITKKFTEN